MDEAATDKFLRFQQPNIFGRAFEAQNTQYKDKWTVDVFQRWQAMGKIKFSALEMRSVFKDYDFHCVQGLERETIGHEQPFL